MRLLFAVWFIIYLRAKILCGTPSSSVVAHTRASLSFWQERGRPGFVVHRALESALSGCQIHHSFAIIIRIKTDCRPRFIVAAGEYAIVIIGLPILTAFTSFIL